MIRGRRGLGFSAFGIAVFALGIASQAGGQLIPARALFGEHAIQSVAVNPSGTHIAALAQLEGTYGVLVQEVETGAIDPVYRGRGEISFLGWVDDNTLVVVENEKSRTRTHLLELDQQEYSLEFEKKRVRADGWLEDPLPSFPDEVLWARRDSKRSEVFRVPTSELVEPSGSGGFSNRIGERYRLAKMSEFVVAWIPDRHGQVRAALARRGEEEPRAELLYRDEADSGWRDLESWSDLDDLAHPVGFAANGRDLLVLSSEGRDTAALREYLVDEKKIGKLVYANPDADVVGVLYDYVGAEVQAAIYEEGGLQKYHHLKSFGARQQQWLEETFLDQRVQITSLTTDRRFLSVLVTGPTNPGHYYLADTKNEKTLSLGETMPWLDPSRLVAVDALNIVSGDGTKIEAFLALPRRFEGDHPPLVVMPHGGPIGVRDGRDFSPDTQYLAAQGLAVLTVNYRGSEGYGRAFLEAGKQQWGKAIEDDIDAAVDQVIASGSVDPERICIAGSSYGGYSALISVARDSNRYRCAASLAGPTDLLLMFESSDCAHYQYCRQELEKIIGSPDEDPAELIAQSPAYRAAEISVPIFLAHAKQDRRVDVEHAYRMKAMLDAYGKEYVWLLIEGGHSPTREEYIRFIPNLSQFLRKHLEPRSPDGGDSTVGLTR